MEVVTFCSWFPDRNILPASAAQALSAATGTVCWAPRPSKVWAFENYYFKMTTFKIVWPIELNDLWSKKICGPEMIVWSSATFILRDRWRYPIGWIFGKVPKGGCIFNQFMVNKWNISIKVIQLLPKYQTGYLWIVENREWKKSSFTSLPPSSTTTAFILYPNSPTIHPVLSPSTPVYVIVQKNYRDMEKDNSTKVKQIERASYLPTWCKIAQSHWRCRRRGAEAVGGHKHHKGGKRQKKYQKILRSSMFKLIWSYPAVLTRA